MHYLSFAIYCSEALRKKGQNTTRYNMLFCPFTFFTTIGTNQVIHSLSSHLFLYVPLDADIQTPHSHTPVIQSPHKYACACICCLHSFSAAFFSRTAKMLVPRKKSAGRFLKKCVKSGYYALSRDINTTHSTCPVPGNRSTARTFSTV